MTDQAAIFHTSTGDMLPAIDAAGRRRFLGMKPTPASLKAVVPTWVGAGKPIIPESEWRVVDRRDVGKDLPSVDQGSHGSCTNGATRGALEFARHAAGAPYIPLSGTWAYAHCNGGSDGGANIGDVMQFTMKSGLCTDAAFPETQIFERQSSDLARCRAEQTRFRWAEIYQADNSTELISALMCGYEVVSAVCVGWNFNVDRSTLKVNAGGGMANHAIHATGLLRINGEWLVLYRNSWGDDWPWQGGGGWFAMSQDQIDKTKWQEIWVGRYPTGDPEDHGGPVVMT